MSEATEKLRATLDDLHAQLASMNEVEPAAQALLKSAVSDLRQKLDEQGAPASSAEFGESASIVDRLHEAARHFEESHPTLTGAIGSVIDALGRMGI